MRLSLLLAACLAGVPPAPAPDLPSAATLLEGLAEKQRVYEKALDDYTYDLEVVTEKLDKKGGIASRRSRQYEVFFVKGKRARRLVAEDGVALTAERQAKVDKDLDKYVEDVREGRARPPRQSPDQLSQILGRYHFRPVAREDVEGRPAIVLDFEPLPGKRDLEGDFALRRLSGRVFIDEAERAPVRVEMRSTGTIKVALGLGASIKDVQVTSEFVKVGDDLWLPRRVETEVVGRVLLLKGIRERNVATFSRYRRYSVDVEETPVRPAP